jgi:hypothetical protein
MSALPPPPRDESGELATHRWQVITELRGGISAACACCGQTTGTWWCDASGARAAFYPVHERCVDKLIEAWREMIAHGVDQGLVSAALTGAYARRAAARTAATGSAHTVVASRSVDGGSPYFRPGMAQGTPWTACARSALGQVVITPCGGDEQRAVMLVVQWETLARGNHHGPGTAPVLGGAVVGPDGRASHCWGLAPVPGSPPPWEPIDHVSWTDSCRRCGAELRVGCWRGVESGQCLACLRETSPRPWWPADVPKPAPVVTRKAKRKPATLD